MHSPRQNTVRAGFSLAEILVAASLVILLLALLLPAVHTLRARAGTTTCAANLRQLAMAGLNQIQDRNGLLPDMGVYPSHKKSDETLSLLPYLGYALTNEKYLQPTVFTCPSAWAACPTQTPMHRTYGINRYTTGSRINQPDDFEKIREAVPHRFSAIAQPSATAFFMEGKPRSDDPEATYYVDQNYARLLPVNGPESTAYLHGEAMHVVFMDGHVERITKSYSTHYLTERGSTRHPFWGASK